MLALYATIINIINHKFYSGLISIKYRKKQKRRNPVHLITLKEAKERYYPERRYAVVRAGSDNYPSWLCGNIEEAKEIIENSYQSLYIVDLGDVR